MDPQEAALDRVREAATVAQQAGDAYDAALEGRAEAVRAARDAGVPWAALTAATGVTMQALHATLKRKSKA
ncbi:hypothetical protein [Georgenia yuyongxinii]|uniref:Uncharacterized protein n=1 Tax=Georgenia yuyongxinii TaxID=2589797 RepID=A0A552WUG6_9MICO|nr:hypothetical protein [Georgenia yuyongxinii]TRW46397.1 hypothetical protein FJ693_05575 [Georgenia yuyongxinii]